MSTQQSANSPEVAESNGRRTRAVLYLRVSTPSQVNTDYNPEGISIPAQREACERKATELHADIIREFIEPGRTATSIEKRPSFQEMLAWVKAERDIDYVIVYHFSRIFRNTVDAAITKRDLSRFGTRIISTVLHLNDSPESQMIESIMHAVDQYQSQASGADIRYKMAQKIKNGGTAGKAKMGYLNVRDHIEGREVRTIAVDPERAPFVKQAFELFATGDYTGPQLQQLLADAGLTTRGDRRLPSQPLSLTRVYEMLADRYYMGYVSYQGEEYKGRHEPLVDEVLFERVQRVLALHGSDGTRERRYDHFLKGVLWCGACGSRMIIQRGKGRGGTYFYFGCRGKQQRTCSQPYLPIHEVEVHVERHYATVRLTDEFRARVRQQLDDVLKDELGGLDRLRKQLHDRLKALDGREEQYLDLLGDPAWPHDKIKKKLAAIETERVDLRSQLMSTVGKLDTGRQYFQMALDLLADPQRLYRQAGTSLKRALNKVIFAKLYVQDDGVLASQFTAGLAPILAAEEQRRVYLRREVTAALAEGWNDNGPVLLDGSVPIFGTRADLLSGVLVDPGSSKPALVEVAGIEPASFGGLTGLLRAQLVMSLLGPTGLPSKPV